MSPMNANDSPPRPADAGATASPDAGDSFESKVAAVIELIRPAVQADGGDIELVGVSDEGRASIRFHGACVGCPSSAMTLYHGIERTLKDRVPGVTGVDQVD